jgi:hypothetical protein
MRKSPAEARTRCNPDPEKEHDGVFNREVAFMLILLDARDHWRDCRHVEPGELLEMLLTAYFWEPESQDKELSEVRQRLASKGIEVGPPPVYVRRTNNQVSAELEAIIRNLSARRWTKVDIARVLRVNRRVVLRVAREAARGKTSECTDHDADKMLTSEASPKPQGATLQGIDS